MDGFGLLQVMSNADIERQQNAEAEARQQAPMVQELAGYVRKCYDTSKSNHNELRERMMKCLRQRMGQYDPDVLAKLEEQGGAHVYMLLTETKCRAAEAWLRDILLSSSNIPWDIEPTPVADLSSVEMEQVAAMIQGQLSSILPVFGGQPEPAQMSEIQELVARKIKAKRQEEANQRIDGMRMVMHDQIKEGMLEEAFDSFISDLVTYPYAVLKGPCIVMKPALAWVPGEDGQMSAQVQDKLTMKFTRVSPLDFFFEMGIEHIRDGYAIERHTLSRADVAAMKGQPGYDDGAVSLVLQEYEQGMLNDWLDVDYQQWERERLESKRGAMMIKEPTPTFKALEFWGSVSGRMLVDWGMPDEEVDADTEYEVSVWLIGRHVVRAVLNADPLAEKPYHVNTYVRVPGSLVGKGLPEMIADVQSMCNAAARAIVNNMLIASGPQVEVNVDRLPPNEEITEMFPWKIWQTLNDPSGTTAPAVRFEQPTMNAETLMGVYEKFSRMADEQSGIPAYTYGDTDIQGAGRTSSGLAMLMGSAGKGIRQIITSLDLKILRPLLQQLYRWNMRYHDDPDIKGDAQVVARGTAMIVKEQLNMRRVEFLQITANPIDAELVGLKGRAAILREVARGLEMDVDKIVPTDDELDIREKLMMLQGGAPVPGQQQPGAQGPQGGAQAPKPAAGRPAGATMDQGATVARA